MKKFYFIWTVAIITVIIAFCSCSPTEPNFDKALLVGKWQSGTLFEKYLSGGSGSTWDTADDVTEAEAQKFTWTLEKSTLTQLHIMEVGGTVPKTYTITTLTDSTMTYRDDYGTSPKFVKVK